MRTNNTTYIHTFDCGIYPRLLWVVTDFDELEDFTKTYDDGTEETLKRITDESVSAVTDHAYLEKLQRGGVIIRFRSKKEINPMVVAHEATHAAMMIFDYCGCHVDVNNQEPFAYLVGWIVECCFKVKNYKRGGNNETSPCKEIPLGVSGEEETEGKAD